MAPPASAVARRAPARSSPQTEGAASRRPPLRLFEPARRRRRAARQVRRPAFVWLSGLVVVGSLLAVVAGDALLAEGQVRLSGLQARVANAVAQQKSLQVAVSEKAAPPVVVGQAEAAGLVAPTQVVYLPQVPLDVPLPAPHLTPLAARTASPPPATGSPTTASASSAASASAASASAASASAASAKATATTNPSATAPRPATASSGR